MPVTRKAAGAILTSQHMADLRQLIPATTKRCVYSTYVKDICPFHNDQRPSFLIWPNRYECKACGAKGVEWNGQRGTQVEAISSAEVAPPTPLFLETALQYTAALGEAQTTYLTRQRGLSPLTVQRFLLGYGSPPDSNTPRYAIPIAEGKQLINIKFRRDDALEGEDAPKYVGIKDHNAPHLWGASGVRDASKAIITAGEFDRIIAHQELMPAIYPITSTGGEQAWRDEWTKMLYNVERLFVCYDSDKAGAEASITLCRKLRDGGLFPIVVELPSHTKDITEFMVAEGRGAFMQLLPSSNRIWFLATKIN